jgi:HEPN domain-containing protein
LNHSAEHARLLLAKAGEDRYALDRLALDPKAPLAILGFHAQQAVEKMLKAVLTSRAIRYGRTHDLVHLAMLLQRHGLVCPESAHSLQQLNRFAVDLRYDVATGNDASQPSAAQLTALVQCVSEWANVVVGAAGSPPAA